MPVRFKDAFQPFCASSEVTWVWNIRSAQSLQEEFSKLYLGKKSIYLASLQRRPFLPLQILSPWQQTQLVSLLTATLCSARQEVVIPCISELLPSLLSLASQTEHEKTIVSAAQCLAGIINKIPEGDQLTEVLNDFITRIWQVGEKEGSQRKATITWLWLTKALVLRSHPLAYRFIEKILNLLEDKSVGHLTAEGFYIIMADFEEVMTIKTHVNYKLMYRQRFFMETAPKLMKGFQSTKSEFKYNYLLGLSHLLEWIPRQVLLSEVSNLMALLMQSLSFDEQKLQLSTLRTVNSLILDAPEVVTRNVTSIVPILLRLFKYEPMMKIRIEALRCLGALTTLPHHAVYPYKAKVCRALAYSVDDKKRLVRKEAVNCRNEWHLLGSSAI